MMQVCTTKTGKAEHIKNNKLPSWNQGLSPIIQHFCLYTAAGIARPTPASGNAECFRRRAAVEDNGSAAWPLKPFPMPGLA